MRAGQLSPCQGTCLLGPSSPLQRGCQSSGRPAQLLPPWVLPVSMCPPQGQLAGGPGPPGALCWTAAARQSPQERVGSWLPLRPVSGVHCRSVWSSPSAPSSASCVCLRPLSLSSPCPGARPASQHGLGKPSVSVCPCPPQRAPPCLALTLSNLAQVGGDTRCLPQPSHPAASSPRAFLEEE